MSASAEMKTEFYFDTAEKAKKIMKQTAEKLDYRYQEMNSIAVAYKHGAEAIVKYDDKLEVYEEEAEEKIEAMED